MRNQFSLHAFGDWLEQQPPEKTYKYFCNETCAICQYFDFLGLQYKWVGPDQWLDADNKCHPMPPGFDAVSAGRTEEISNYCSAAWTFGAAAQRARAMQA